MKKIVKRIFLGIGIFLGTFLLIVAIYVCYVLIQYYRIEDNQELEITHNANETMDSSKTFRIATYNIGFGAYRPDYSFFMDEGYNSDGTKVVGKYARAKSKESVLESTEGVKNEINNLNIDFAFFQEVDTDSTRSYHVNQCQILSESFLNFDSHFASNYHSAYLFYPFSQPIGKSNSGLLTISKYKIDSATRISYPISNKFDKFFDLDRCFSVSRIKVGDHELVLVNSHMSAYDEGGYIRAQQIQTMKSFCEEEIKKNNYLVFGGDFNHDLLKNHPDFQYTNKSKPLWMNFTQLKPDWLASIDYEKDLADHILPAVNDNNPTCRDADIPLIGHEDEVYKSVIDGFFVSDNIEIISVENIDNGFEYSDHQPVLLEFKLK